MRRAAFALLATLAVHDKPASNADFVAALSLIEAAAGDERNFVKKAVNWALRNIGKRNPALNQAAIDAARRIQATRLALRALDCRRRPARAHRRRGAGPAEGAGLTPASFPKKSIENGHNPA